MDPTPDSDIIFGKILADSPAASLTGTPMQHSSNKNLTISIIVGEVCDVQPNFFVSHPLLKTSNLVLTKAALELVAHCVLIYS